MLSLAQAIQQELQEGLMLGLSARDWAILLPLITSFVVAVIKALKGHKAEKKNEILTDAIEEATDAGHSAKHVKTLVRSKAMLSGLEGGMWGLKKDKERATTRLEIKKNGGPDA